MSDPVESARRLADEVLLPDAPAVDRADSIPVRHLEALDDAGLTGLAATDADLVMRLDAAAALAGGCLATAFVWLQQQGALAALSRASGPGRSAADDVASGRLRAGVAITNVRPPEPLRLVGRGDHRRLVGSVPWVTGWGLVEVLRVAAIDDDGRVATVLVDVGPGMTADPVHLVAASASGTVLLHLEDVPAPQDRDLDAVTVEQWAAADAAGLALNGALALGVAHRAGVLAGSESVLAGVAAARSQLLAADAAGLPAARAACTAAALRAAAVLGARDAGRGVSAGSDADRLLREAHFLMGFGSRPPIRHALLDRFGA